MRYCTENSFFEGERSEASFPEELCNVLIGIICSRQEAGSCLLKMIL